MGQGKQLAGRGVRNPDFPSLLQPGLALGLAMRQNPGREASESLILLIGLSLCQSSSWNLVVCWARPRGRGSRLGSVGEGGEGGGGGEWGE